MQITLFSFVTAVLLSSLLIVVLYLSRKSVKTIRMLNFGYLACLYLFCPRPLPPPPPCRLPLR